MEHRSEASSAQVHDWLKEHHHDFIEVDEKTVSNFVLHVRSKYGIPKSFDHCDYEKIHYISFVLSRSRMKYSYFSDRQFTTRKVIMAHEAAIGQSKPVGIDGDLMRKNRKFNET